LLLVGSRGAHNPTAVISDASPHQGTVGLFVSILVRYPEVASVTYRRDSHSLKLTLLVKSRLDEGRLAVLRDLLHKSVTVYSRLVRRAIRLCELQVKTRQGLTVLELRRDVDSLTQNEISMVLGLTRQFFGEELVVDHIPNVAGDELAVQEELIEEMLDDLRDSTAQPNLIAFREEGRVLVFNQ
jgi:hypothetical protein